MLRAAVNLKRLLFTCAVVGSLAVPASAADPRWTMVRTPSLTVIGDQSAARLRDVANQIERFHKVVAGLITNANRPLSLPTVVYVFGQRASLRPFVPLYNGKPIDVAGFFQGSVDQNVIVLSMDAFEEAASVVFHEYTHLLVRNAVRSPATWLNEGLAEYYSGYQLDGDKAATIGRPLARHILLLRDQYIPISELLGVNDSSPLYNEGTKRSIFYAESWALTHYLMTTVPNGAAVINSYSTATSEGQTPTEAFRTAFGTTPAEFDRRLRTYVNQFQFAAQRIEFKDRIATAAAGPPTTLSAGEANAWLGDLQRRLNRVPEATARIEAAVASDPASPMPHTALGLLRLVEHREADGLDSLRKAAELAPDDFLVQFTRGVWDLSANGLGSSDAATGALAALKRAVALNASSADAHGWLAYAQMASPESMKDARLSIERAIQLAPGRNDFVIRWADIRIRLGDYDEAKGVLSKIAALKNDPGAAAAAREGLEQLTRYEAEVARRKTARAQFELAERSVGRSGAEASTTASTSPSPTAADRGSLGTTGTEAPARHDISARSARLMLRKVGAEEERANGLLLKIDCTPSEVRFHVQSGERTLTATAKRMEDVELTQFLDSKDFEISCGPRPRPDSVYLTWRRDETPVQGRVGVAMSVEFVPKGYVP